VEEVATTGLVLAHEYAAEVVEPLLARELPALRVAVARLGSGSDVLGLDDDTSCDHDWGLRLTVLVDAADVGRVDAVLERHLPAAWRGHPTRFTTTWDPTVRQRAEVASPVGFARSRTGLRLDCDPDTVGWLSLTGQAALEVAGGAVFRDDTGELTAIRRRLTWYPADVWRFALAADWSRLGAELPFVGRAADRGDDVGSRILAARLARTAMHLAFLLQRRWPPYAKWLGTAFASLPGTAEVSAPLDRALAAVDGRARQDALVEAVEALALLQGEVGLPTLTPVTAPFWDRATRGLRDIAALVRETIDDAELRRGPPVGTVEQWSDNVALLVDAERRLAATRALWAG
jgi:hypothetical protein